MSAILRLIPYAARAQIRCLWHWRWPMLAVAWALAVIGWLTLALVPDRYEASSRIYVDTDSLLGPLLKNITVETDPQNQLEVMQRTLLGRTNLAQLARTTGLDRDLQTEAEREKLYLVLQKKIAVTAEGRNLFSVSYRDTNPAMASKVVATLLDIFVDTNVNHNRANMQDARSFIDGQIAEYEDKLKQAEHRLAEYKAEHLDLLVTTGANFAPRMEAAREELSNARQKYDEAVITRDQVRTGLRGVPKMLDVDTLAMGGGAYVGGGPLAGATPAAKVRQLEADLAQLETRFTDRHPDVVAAKRALQMARATAAARPDSDEIPAAPRGHISNPVYDQLEVRLVQAETDVASAHSRLQLATANMERLSALAGVAPKVEAELADLNREYGVLKSKYEELLGRRESARISAAAESNGDKVQYRVIEPPHLPARPDWPNRPLFVTAILVLALGASLAGGLGLNHFDDTIGTPESLEGRFDVTVIGCLPRLESPAQSRRRQVANRQFIAAAAALLLLFAVALGLSTHWQQLVGQLAPQAAERSLSHGQ